MKIRCPPARAAIASRAAIARHDVATVVDTAATGSGIAHPDAQDDVPVVAGEGQGDEVAAGISGPALDGDRAQHARPSVLDVLQDQQLAARVHPVVVV